VNPDRAKAFVDQALALLPELESRITLPNDSMGNWVSLKRNLESAQADLAEIAPGA